MVSSRSRTAAGLTSGEAASFSSAWWPRIEVPFALFFVISS